MPFSVAYSIWSSKARQILQQEARKSLNFRKDVDAFFDPMNRNHFRVDCESAEDADSFLAGLRGNGTEINIGTALLFISTKSREKMGVGEFTQNLECGRILNGFHCWV